MLTSPPETLVLPVGVLARLLESDAGEVALAVRGSLDHLRPWMPWATAEATTEAAQRRRCREAQNLWNSGSDYVYALRPARSEPVIGQFGLHRRIGPGALEIGYWMHADHAGRGYGTAAADALTRTALALPGITRVEIHTDQANTASAAIPRRLGYRLDRVETHPPEAPAESGHRQIWIMDSPGTSR